MNKQINEWTWIVKNFRLKIKFRKRNFEKLNFNDLEFLREINKQIWNNNNNNTENNI